jgi:dTDP-4-amino-4,6-dideoxygalactose transaminase
VDGARVLIPALTFPATATAVINAGFTPVLSDVDAERWEMLPHHAQKAMAEQSIGAVMPVSAFGKPIPFNDWDQFMVETGVPVVADTAAALGQQPIGKHIHMAFSLHATKPFSIGEGGLLVTPDAELASRAKSWSNFGFSGPGGVISQIGTNAKMGEYYAATGLAQIKRWQHIKSRRQSVLDKYRETLAPLGNALKWQASSDPFIPATFVVHTDGKANHIAQAMADAGIHTRFWYLPPLYEHPALENIAKGIDPKKAFPVTEELKDSLIGLPFHTFLSQQDIEDISATLAEVL